MHRSSLRFAFCAWLLPVAFSVHLLGCSGSSGHVDAPKSLGAASASAVEAPPDPCAVAAGLRTKVKPFLDEGRLHRTVKLIEKADRLCPKSAPDSYAALVTTLAELGKYAEARKVTATIEADSKASVEAKAAAQAAKERCDKLDRIFPEGDEAKKKMRQLFAGAQLAAEKDDAESTRIAKEKYLAAWEAWRPNGQALVGAAVAAKRLGQNAEMQRLFDRAIQETETAQGKELALDVPTAFGEGIKCIAWSQDGRRFAVAHGREVLIFDTTWREKFHLRGHEGEVTSLAFAPDGKTLVSGSDDDTARIWDMYTGNEIRKLDKQGVDVRAVAYAPDGKTIAVGNGRELVRLWDPTTGKQVRSLSMTRGYGIKALAYSPDGKKLAASEGTRIRLWNSATGAELGTFDSHGVLISSLAYSPDGKSLASTDVAGHVQLWNVATGKVMHSFEGRQATLNQVTYSPDGKTIAVAGLSDETLRIWDIATEKPVLTFAGDGSSAYPIIYAPDGKTVAAVVNNHVQWVDVVTGKVLRIAGAQTTAVRSVAYSRNGNVLVSGADDKNVRIWDIAAGNRMRTLVGHDRRVNSVAISSDGATVASGSLDETVRIWDVVTGKPLRTMEGHRANIKSVVYSPDGSILASGSEDTTIRLWEVATGKPLREFHNDAGAVLGLAYSPDGRLLASAMEDRTVELWNPTDGSRVRTFGQHGGNVESLAFAPDGQMIASSSPGDDRVCLWNVATAQFAYGLDVGAISVAFTPDGKTLATGTWPNLLQLWDLGSRNEPRILTDHDAVVFSLAFAPNGKTLAAGGFASIQIYRVADGVLLATLHALTMKDAGYLFTPSGYIDILGPDACPARIHPVCRIGNLTFPFDVCEERFYAPGLLAKIHVGDTSYLEPENAPTLMNCSATSP